MHKLDHAGVVLLAFSRGALWAFALGSAAVLGWVLLARACSILGLV